MLSFISGLFVGKMYLAEMVFVPQITYLSVIGVSKVSPTMKALGYLKYVFGYSLANIFTSSNPNIGQNKTQSYLELVGLSEYFI
jgi:hypothetical protein